MRAILLLAVCSSTFCELNTKESIKKLSISEKQRKKLEELHYGWYVQAVSALLGAVGKEEFRKMNRANRRSFIACLNAIEEEHDIKMGADCLVKAFDNKLVSSFSSALNSRLYDFVETRGPKRRVSKSKKKFDSTVFKAKRIKFRQRTWKEYRKPRKSLRRRIKRNLLSLYTNEEMRREAKMLDRNDSVFKPVNMKSAPALIDTRKSPVKVITTMLGGIVRTIKNETREDQISLQQSFKKLKKLQRTVSERKEGGKFKHRMLDMVLGQNHPFRRRKTFSDRFRDIMPKSEHVDEVVYGLVDAVSRNSEDVNVNFLSPRIMPLLPDRYSSKRKLLSPSLFPLYKDDSENSILSIPKVLEDSGMNEKDREAILELVIDASGVNKVVDDALNTINTLGMGELGGDVLGITKLVDETFGNISKSLNSKQRRDMKNKKYAFLNRKQLDVLYGEKGLYNTSQSPIPFDLNEISSLSQKEKEVSLKETIRNLAKGEVRREKRTIEKVTYFRHTTLSPFGFAPTMNTLVVLGPLTLSPSIFSPSIISPLLLSPPVISPQVGNPLIFSPYVLGPNVLSAAVFNVYVFSPYVLSPNVINPYVMSPLILSPFVLCPDVVSPTVLSGVILSPAVLSPSIFTESALAANVLSPTFLS